MSNAQQFLKKVISDPALKDKCLYLYENKDKKGLEKISWDLGTPCSFQEMEEEMKHHDLFSNEISEEDLLRIQAGIHDSQDSHGKGD